MPFAVAPRGRRSAGLRRGPRRGPPDVRPQKAEPRGRHFPWSEMRLISYTIFLPANGLGVTWTEATTASRNWVWGAFVMRDAAMSSSAPIAQAW